MDKQTSELLRKARELLTETETAIANEVESGVRTVNRSKSLVLLVDALLDVIERLEARVTQLEDRKRRK